MKFSIDEDGNLTYTTEVTEDIQRNITVTKNLAELLTNSVNMADKFYEIFLDSEPHLVELEMYGKDGILKTVTIPNRALDKTIAYTGIGTPEEAIEATSGALYVDLDKQQLYIKTTEAGNLGWQNITPQPIEIYKEEHNVNHLTTKITIRNKVEREEDINVYLNGVLLNSNEYSVDVNTKEIFLLEEMPDGGLLQVQYINGLYGIKGDTALTFSVGDVETLEPDEQAYVTQGDDPKNIVLNYGIPRGVKGESGVWTGPEEPTNPDFDVWIDTSATGFTTDELSVSRIVDSGNNINPTAYRKAYQTMHSSIDESKFMLYGNAVLDDNGLLTILENQAGLRTSTKVKYLSGKNWSISGRDYIDDTKGSYHYMFTIGAINGQGCSFRFDNAAKSFVYIDRNGAIYKTLFSDTTQYAAHGAGWYNWKVEFKDGFYYFYLSHETNVLALMLITEHTNINQPLEEYVYIACDDISNHSVTQSDVKVFSIISDGILIWTANKTGIHHIYDDHFDKIGNPVITNEGFLTHIMNGKHYIYGDLKASSLINKTWDIRGHFRHLGPSQVLWQFADPNNIVSEPLETDEHAGDYKMLSAVIEDNKLMFYLVVGTTTRHTNTQRFDFNLTLNKDYYYKMKHLFNDVYEFTLSENEDFSNPTILTYNPYETNPPSTDPYVSNAFPNYQLVIGSSNTIETVEKVVCNNLNFFKVNLHDRFEYRPLLRVPCTYSKYGAIFVEPKQRAIVQEAYKVHGIGNIYVLDEVNRAVTLPLSDLYSLIEKEYESRPIIGKGLNLDKKQNLLENLVEGLEIGDIGEAVTVDESIGTRRILNGQIVNVDNNLQTFFEYVQALRDKDLVVTNEEWEAEASTSATGDCNKFVITSVTSSFVDHYFAYIPDNMVIKTPVYDEEGHIISYTISISSDLTEYDIVYTTSQDPLAENTVFRKVNDIIYPVTDIHIVELLNPDLYTRYNTADFEKTVTREVGNTIRLPHLTSSRAGYVYYIQVTTGVKNNVNVENDYHAISPYAFGMYQYADVDINSAGWLLSNGSWYSGDIYPSFYEWIKARANALIDREWIQPIFRSNTYKDDSNVTYTLTASHESQPAYYAFEKSLVADHCWWTAHGVTSVDNPCWLQFHSTESLKISKVIIMNENTSPENFKTGVFQASTDGLNWKNLCNMTGVNSAATGTGQPGGMVTVNVDWNNTLSTLTDNEKNLGFTYYRLYFTESYSTGGVSIQQIQFIATTKYDPRFKKYNNPVYSVTDYDFVIDESNRTFRLPNIANACDYSKMRYLVEKKEMNEGDLTWYNLYSDGWLEQGGTYTLSATTNSWSGYTTLTFPKNFINTAYNFDFTPPQLNSGSYGTGVELTNKYVNSIRYRSYNQGSQTKWWKATGYATPPAFDTYRHLLPRLYYYVGDTLQTRKHINMAELANQFAEFKSQPILTAPQRTYQEIACPASGQTVVSPGDGWMYFKRTSTATNQYLALYDSVTGLGELQWIAANANWAQTIIPVYKGQIITVQYSAGTHNFLRFVESNRGIQ